LERREKRKSGINGTKKKPEGKKGEGNRRPGVKKRKMETDRTYVVIGSPTRTWGQTTLTAFIG